MPAYTNMLGKKQFLGGILYNFGNLKKITKLQIQNQVQDLSSALCKWGTLKLKFHYLHGKSTFVL